MTTRPSAGPACSVLHTVTDVDPELQSFLDKVPPLKLDAERLAKSRHFVVQAAQAQQKHVDERLDITELQVESRHGGPAIRVLRYRPKAMTPNGGKPSGLSSEQADFKDASSSGEPSVGAETQNPVSPLPAVLHAHAGGYVMGLPEMAHKENGELALDSHCVVYSVDYRLAPENVYPSALQDLYSVLLWMHEQADQEHIDRHCIGVKGESAGGGLAAALALYTRDHGGPRLAFQHLFYPMLDDRTCTRTDLPAHMGAHLWKPEHNVFGWSAVLGKAPGGAEVSCYAAPARATDLAGLPPCFLAVGGLDLFCDEVMAYARGLSRAGVPLEFHVYPGAYHGFRSVAQARVTQQAYDDSMDYLRRYLQRSL